MRTRKATYADRDDIANHFINAWRDAVAFKYDQSTLLKAFSRIFESAEWKRLPRYQKEYCRGFERCYQLNVIDRMYLEHGNWVEMPDGTTQWFGLEARLNSQSVYKAGIDYKYLSEHSIPERTGIYWRADAKCNVADGEKPFFVGKGEAQ